MTTIAIQTICNPTPFFLADNYLEPFREKRYWERHVSPTYRFEDTPIAIWLESKGLSLNAFKLLPFQDGYKVLPRLVLLCPPYMIVKHITCYRVPSYHEVSAFMKILGADILFCDSGRLVIDGPIPIEGDIILDIFSSPIQEPNETKFITIRRD